MSIVCIVPGLLATIGFADNNESKNLSSKIVGGENAKPDEYKFFAQIVKGRSQCGGAILNRNHVLTTAWCVYNMSNLVVVTGGRWGPTHLRVEDDENEQKRRVIRAITHPDYEHSMDPADIPLPGDVAVLKLEKPLRFDNYVGDPVTIPNSKLEKKALRAGNCMTMGFGVNNENSFSYPKRLQKVSVNVRSTSFCSREWDSMLGTRWNAKLLCTYQRDGKNICFGDAAVPLVCYVGKKPILLGAMAFGVLPCSDGHAGWNRMKSYRSWIQQYV